MPNNPETIEINSMEQLAMAFAHWHQNKLKVLQHYMSIPEGSEISFDEGKAIVLSGNNRDAFIAGLQYALMEFGDLPFTLDLEDDPSQLN